MAFAQSLAIPVEHSAKFSHFSSSVPTPCSLTFPPSFLAPFSSFKSSADKFSLFAIPRRIGRHAIEIQYLQNLVEHLDTDTSIKDPKSALKWSISKSLLHPNAQPQDSETTAAADAFTHFKHLLLPITDRNPYLSEGTRQAAATTAALAKKYGADITVVVIDEQQKESLPEHQTQLASIRWHLSEGGFQEFKLLERLGEGSKLTAIIGEVADDMRLDLVVLSMEAIHSKHVDANLLAEFIPCPVLLLPL